MKFIAKNFVQFCCIAVFAVIAFEFAAANCQYYQIANYSNTSEALAGHLNATC